MQLAFNRIIATLSVTIRVRVTVGDTDRVRASDWVKVTVRVSD